MVAYTQNELVSATEISKQFGEYISKVKNGVIDKIGVLKNNKLNAVILSVEEYERMSEAMKEIESQRFINSIEKGLDDVKNNRVSNIDTLWDKLDDSV